MATPVAKSSQPTSGGSRDSKSSYSRTEPGSGCLLPEAQEAEFPALLDSPAPRLRTYPKETVVAEKLEAMVKLGMANSRMKDFYDLVVLCTRFDFDGIVLSRAIRATFERRATPLPTDLPLALTPMFTTDPRRKLNGPRSYARPGFTMPTAWRAPQAPSLASSGPYFPRSHAATSWRGDG